MQCICEQLADGLTDLSSVCIGNIWMFKDLGAEELKALATSALKKKIDKGHLLFSQGDMADEMFLIKGGRVKLSKIMEDGTEIMLDIRKGGDIVGESMFSEETEYPVNALCIEDTFTCGFDRNSFESLIMKFPNIGLRVIRNMSAQISWLTSQVGNMSVSNIEDRLYRVLINVAKVHGTETSKGITIPFPLTHEELSFLIGAHRVSVTRAIKSLRKSGKIISEGKKLIFPFLSDSILAGSVMSG